MGRYEGGRIVRAVRHTRREQADGRNARR
jgi:hypothetical protein